jgi:hypothetical protein
MKKEELAKMTVHPKSEDFIQLYSGRDFYFLNPDPDDIDEEDSVAQHSVLASYNCALGYEFEALMHDASEAYLVDMPRPIKNTLQGYRDLEANLDKVVRQKYGLPLEMTEECKRIDNVMLATERRDLMPPTRSPWIWLPEPLEMKINPWSPEKAAKKFIERFDELQGIN